MANRGNRGYFQLRRRKPKCVLAAPKKPKAEPKAPEKVKAQPKTEKKAS